MLRFQLRHIYALGAQRKRQSCSKSTINAGPTGPHSVPRPLIFVAHPPKGAIEGALTDSLFQIAAMREQITLCRTDLRQ